MRTRSVQAVSNASRVMASPVRVAREEMATLPDRLDRQAFRRRQPAPLRLRERCGAHEDPFAWQRGSFVAS